MLAACLDARALLILIGCTRASGFRFDETPLTRKLFDAFDTDESGHINIVEVLESRHSLIPLLA